MKIFITLAVFFFVLLPLSFGQAIDSTKTKDIYSLNSFNIRWVYFMGNEDALSFKMEYENVKWGKIMSHLELGGYKSSLIIIDLGFGYGYKIYSHNGYYIYLNNHITFSELGLMSTNWAGPSALFELEFRKRWNKRSILIMPYFRQQLLYSVPEYSHSRNLSHNILDYSYGISIGISRSIYNKKHVAK